MLPDKDFFKNYAKRKNIPWQERNILMEYLQTQILKALSLSKFNDSLSFLGGTCLRFIYNVNRFSEDLDFDLVKKSGFKIEKLAEEISKKLKLSGFDIDTKVKTTENIHIIYFKFKNVLKEFDFNVSKDEKFLVKFKIDFSPFKNIKTETKFTDAFNEHFPLLVNDFSTVFSQKIIAIMFRPYQKGRDFHDLIWFLAQKNAEPNYKILQEKGLKIGNRKELVLEMGKKLKKINLKQAVKDVENFLFYPEQAKWILDLPKYLDGFSG